MESPPYLWDLHPWIHLITDRKYSKKENNLETIQYNNYLYSIYIVLDITQGDVFKQRHCATSRQICCIDETD
uniref:Uncharacterized protein n=1 Tax=Paramormyrops kingsleyae TaxID=1676925 RepID=A0A3B3RKI7_9TELE